MGRSVEANRGNGLTRDGKQVTLSEVLRCEYPLLWIVSVLALATGGCSGGPPRTAPPIIEADAAGKQAIAMYDRDGDGAISGKELDNCPGIKDALEFYDVNHEGKITAAAIAARIHEWQESNIGTAATKVRVLLDGAPLEAATVTFEPEPFLGPNVAAASGQTASNGATIMTIPADASNPQGERKSGVHYGLYKVRISKPIGGKESLPARYNTNTVLGVEIGPRHTEGRQFNLTNRQQGGQSQSRG
jgi:EF hand